MGLAKWISIAAAVAGVTNATFTPTKLISAPRRGEAVPNKSGKTAIYSVSSYSFETHKRTASWEILDIDTGKTSPLASTAEVGEIAWIDDSRILYTNGTELWVSTVENFSKGYKAATLPVEMSNLKIATTKDGNVNFLLTAMANPDGSIYDESKANQPRSTARIYDELYVRHWDYWLTEQRSAIFSGTLKGGRTLSGDGKVKNLLKGIKNIESPIPPFGGTDNFDISPDGKLVAFVSKAPELPKANYTTAYVYLVPHDGSSIAKPINGPNSPGTPKNARGASTSPVFSPDSQQLAYLQMDGESYESDRNQIYITRIGSNKIENLSAKWDRSPASIRFSPNSKSLYIQAEEIGREKLFSLRISNGGKAIPDALTDEGYVSAFHNAGPNAILATNSSIISSSGFYVVPTSGRRASIKPLVEPYKIDAELSGLHHGQVGEFWYPGAKAKVHGWIVKPTNFDSSKKYPLAFLIHGGPQGSWANSWSTRWNPAVFADQGYVVVAINPTGSTGYGQKFVDDIQNNWGGDPYKDLVLGFEHVVKNYKFIDGKNAVAAGASYGGYMINWIQGHDFGRKFKALVCHDGVFSTLDQYTTEELWFMQHDFNGTLWDNRENYERWDPARHTGEWATPELVIHNDLDFRLPVSSGIAMFNVLQSRGVPSRFLNFPDENHWVLKQENSLVWQREVLGWINKYSGIGGVKL
ncbi:dipeptidyl-peptidase 5 [Ascodesmis nigricans]|uniref:Dipeptidyl-peptidase V n=1 Tax=Ascodesmis nigricans TaxID=341454 RepID=A0A4S2MRH5_9PEZI|nr:dipeptidyl-peptidase 5 [Ascodesmis nigricans]